MYWHAFQTSRSLTSTGPVGQYYRPILKKALPWSNARHYSYYWGSVEEVAIDLQTDWRSFSQIKMTMQVITHPACPARAPQMAGISAPRPAQAGCMIEFLLPRLALIEVLDRGARRVTLMHFEGWGIFLCS